MIQLETLIAHHEDKMDSTRIKPRTNNTNEKKQPRNSNPIHALWYSQCPPQGLSKAIKSDYLLTHRVTMQKKFG